MITSIVDLKEFEKLYKFCQKTKELYICGAESRNQMLAKALELSGINVKGYIVERKKLNNVLQYELPLYCLDSFKKTVFNGFIKKSGVICNKEEHLKLNSIFKEKNIRKTYIVPDFLYEQIEKKVKPRYDFFNFEINIVDHCNLNCQCCDHYSPLVQEKIFLSLDVFERDLRRIKELFDVYDKKDIVHIQLTGGEPTLHPQLPQFIKLARKYFPSSHIGLVTNAIKLLEWENNPECNLWQILKENKVFLFVTTYPIRIDFQAIDNKAKEYGLKYARYSDIGNKDTYLENIEDANKIIKKSTNHIFSLDGKKNKQYEFLSCYQFNESGCLKDGKLYQCPLTCHLNHFNSYFKTNLKLCERDVLDIYKASSAKELVEFYSNRTPFCSNCDIKSRYIREFKVSKKDINEWARCDKKSKYAFSIGGKNE